MHFIIPQISNKPGKGKRVLELLTPMVEYSSNEKENFAYFFFTGEQDEDLIWGIESYLQKSDLYEGHLKSKDFQTFAGTLAKEDLPAKELNIVDLEPAFGFLTRPGQTSPSGSSFIWIAELTFKSTHGRAEALEAARPLAKYVEDHEPTTNSYLFLKDLKDERRLFVFEMYDDKAALTETHHKSEAFLKFGGILREKDSVEAKATHGFNALGKGYLGKGGKHIQFR